MMRWGKGAMENTFKVAKALGLFSNAKPFDNIDSQNKKFINYQ